MKKLTKGLLGVILFAIMAVCACFAIPKRAIRARAEGTSISITSTITTFKTSDAGKEFTLGVVMNNSTGAALFGAQATVQFNTTYFEYVGFVKSTQISNSYQGGKSNTATGTIIVAGDNNNQPIPATLTSFTVGSIKLKIKSGITSGTVNDIITVSGAKAPNMSGTDTKPTVQNTYQNITFAEPSNACTITELKVNNQTLTPTGNAYTCTVPYAYKNLNSGFSVKVSAGATHTVSKTALDVGANTISITVTAEDKVTTQTYTLNVSRTAGDTKKALTSLKLLINGGKTLVEKSAADLTSAATFDAGDIPFADKDKLRVEFAKESNLSTAQVILDSGASKGGATLNLGTVNPGAHTLIVKVTPEDGSAANEYKITFNVVAAATSAKLASLTIKIVSGGTETPAKFNEEFSPDTTSYSASFTEGTKVKIEAKAESGFAEVTGDGEYTVPSTAVIKVESQSGGELTYTIRLDKQVNTAGLGLDNLRVVGIKADNSEVALNFTALSDTFYQVRISSNNADIQKYKIYADYDTSYTVEGVGKEYNISRDSGRKKHEVIFFLNNSQVHLITFDIFYESGETALSSVLCNNVAVELLGDAGDIYYHLVGKAVETANIVVSPTESGAKVTIFRYNGGNPEKVSDTSAVKLYNGTNAFTIVVTATDEVNKGVYYLTIFREPAAAKSLESLICGGNPVELTDDLKIYNIKVGSDVDSLEIVASAGQASKVLIEYEGDDIISENTKTIKLTKNESTAGVRVIDEDGNVGKYVVNISRSVSSTNNSMPYIVAIIVISVVAVLVIIALTVVIIVNRRKA